MLPLIVLLLHVSAVCSDSHSLRNYYTVVSAPGSGLPEFSIVGYVDDREIVNYNSDSGRYRPKVQWMEKMEDGYWETNTQIAKGNEATFRNSVRIVMERFNQSGGLHSYQLMEGCELRDDGGVTGYDQFGYDGREFVALDTQTWTYVPTMAQAQITAQRWNSPDVQEGEREKNYLENICIEFLKKYVEIGREDLERRAPYCPDPWFFLLDMSDSSGSLVRGVLHGLTLCDQCGATLCRSQPVSSHLYTSRRNNRGTTECRNLRKDAPGLS